MRPGSIPANLIFQVIFWTVASWLYMVCRLMGLEEYERIQVIAPIRYNVAAIQSTLAGIAIGLILGTIDLLLSRSKLRSQSFGFLVVIKGLIYISTIVLVLSVIHFVTGIAVDKMSIQEELSKLKSFYQQGFLISMLIYALFISFLVSFIKQVSQKFGPGVLGPMILGKYYKPQQEERIFMFLDLRSSTTYAEQIGHVRYSEMIQDCFYDLATQVDRYRAEIYQYVGDEAVIMWKPLNGLREENCLRIYFGFNEQLKNRADYYSEKYGFVPEFKAGINSGLVMVAEVGEIKKEIAYHGDVLNTGARIQGQCNYYGKNLLISGNLREQLKNEDSFKIDLIGSVELKGKLEQVKIYSVDSK